MNSTETSTFVYANPTWSDGDPKAFAVKYIPEKAVVLDVGCGVGGFGKWLRENKHCTVYGLDGHPEAVAAAKDNLDGIEQVDLDDLAAVKRYVGKRTFDRITFIDVLEHCLHPVELLEIFQQSLNKGGQIIISVPNVAHHSVRLGLLRGDFTYQDSGILDKTHVKLYTRATSLQLAEEAGLKVVHVEHTSPAEGFWNFVSKIDPTWSAIQFVLICETK